MIQEALRPILAISVFILMFGVGMDFTGRDLRKSASRPGLIAVLTAVQFICIPALMLLVIHLTGVTPAAATALLLIAACPSGTISNAFTFLAHGNTALSVTLTTISNLVAFVATPAALAVAGHFAGGDTSNTLSFPPGPLLKQLLLSMVIPLSLGYLIRNRFPQFVGRHLRTVRTVCTLLILLVVTMTTLANPPEVGRQLKSLWIPVLIITPLLFILARSIAAAYKLKTPDQRAVLFELPCRNVALAMLIALSVLDRPDLTFIALSFFMLETAMILILTGCMNRFRPSEGLLLKQR